MKQEVRSKIQHTYTSTPPGGVVARLFYWGANLLDTAARAGIEPRPHDPETSTDPLCHYAGIYIISYLTIMKYGKCY